jgi:hypothetical protein
MASTNIKTEGRPQKMYIFRHMRHFISLATFILLTEPVSSEVTLFDLHSAPAGSIPPTPLLRGTSLWVQLRLIKSNFFLTSKHYAKSAKQMNFNESLGTVLNLVAKAWV